MARWAKAATRTTVLAAVFLGVFAGAVAAPSGTVREKELIARAEKIAILWNLGKPTEPRIVEALRQAGTNNWPYELCTNAIFEQTFKQNGYTAKALRVQAGVPPEIPADSRYVLVLRNTGARAMAYRSPGRSIEYKTVPLVGLIMQGELFDRKTKRLLWTVTHWISSEARSNSQPALDFVTALAADGYLEVKPEEVADYSGARGGSSADVVGECPAPGTQ